MEKGEIQKSDTIRKLKDDKLYILNSSVIISKKEF